MHLEKLRLKNFRSFDDVVVDLQPDLTIFVGENNGGKSNAIDAIRLLVPPLNGRREIYCEVTDRRLQCDDPTFELEAEFAQLSAPQQGRLLSATVDHSLSRSIFGLSFNVTHPNARPSIWAGQNRGAPEQGSLEMVRHVYLPPLRDAKRALASGNPTRIMALLKHFTGELCAKDLAKELARNTRHEILGRVDTAVAKGLEALTVGARLQAASLGFSSDESLLDIARDLRFKIADHGIAPENLQYSGHGYANLLYMAIIAVELERAKDADLTLFLVEEPEAHLHPQLQAAVLCFLQEQAAESRKRSNDSCGPAGELQVVVTTHSPNLSAWVPSEKIVVFKSIVEVAPSFSVPSHENAAPAAFENLSHVLEHVRHAPGEREADDVHGSRNLQFRKRRLSCCIPLSKLQMPAKDRRKVDRYLDVTKSALLFGGRILLVEGISEALLFPVIARRILDARPSDYRIFRAAVFVAIEGVDFKPYISLLLGNYNGIRIADRLIVVTDGDRDSSLEQEQGGDSPTSRKKALETHAKLLKGEAYLTVVENTCFLEGELLLAGNESLMRLAFLELHPNSARKWDSALGCDAEKKVEGLRMLFNDIRKGDFAQCLAHVFEESQTFNVPEYASTAIEALVKE